MPEPRSWTIALPMGMELLNANQRLHWSRKGAVTREIRKAAWALARSAKIPPVDKAHVVVEYRPPDARKRDAGNLAPSGKAAIDGIGDAKVWPDDHSGHVLSERYTIGPKTPGGQLLIHITEVAR